MKAIFEHWTVTLLGCLLTDKTWRSNSFSWVYLRIYSGERGRVERRATSYYLSQIPACFLNKCDGNVDGGSDPRTDSASSCIVILPPILEDHFPPLLCFLRGETGLTSKPPEESSKLWALSSQRQTPLPHSPLLTCMHTQNKCLQQIVCKW